MDLKKEKTLIIIAPRLQTIEKCDIVYRVENASIKMVVSVEEDQLIPDYEACEKEFGCAVSVRYRWAYRLYRALRTL